VTTIRTMTIMMRSPPGSYWGEGSEGVFMSRILAAPRDTVRPSGPDIK
jgi:hypothetical protein